MELPADVHAALTRILRHIDRTERADWEITRDDCVRRGVLPPRHVYDDALAVAKALHIALGSSEAELQGFLKEDNLDL